MRSIKQPWLVATLLLLFVVVNLKVPYPAGASLLSDLRLDSCTLADGTTRYTWSAEITRMPTQYIIQPGAQCVPLWPEMLDSSKQIIRIPLANGTYYTIQIEIPKLIELPYVGKPVPVNPPVETPPAELVVPVTPQPEPVIPVPIEPDTSPEVLTANERQMLELVNSEREKSGLPPLVPDMRLAELARLKSQDMITNGYFAHQSPTYGSPFDMMKEAAITYKTAGENLAGAWNVERAHTSLMNSPGHRRNILNPAFTHIGIGIIEGGPYGLMVTQMFIGI